jgi:hypothetical protein
MLTPPLAVHTPVRMIALDDSSLPEKFWSKVSPCPNTGCWLWTGCVNANGYGSHGRAARHSGSKLTHRFTYEAAFGPLPAGTEIDHKVCRTRSCCNPAHLEAVPHRINVLRGSAKKSACKRGHALEGSNLLPIKGGASSRCKACVEIAAQEREAARRAAYVPAPRILPPNFPCGHDRSATNSVSNGSGGTRCRECNRRNSQLRNEKLREAG